MDIIKLLKGSPEQFTVFETWPILALYEILLLYDGFITINVFAYLFY